MLVRRGVRTAVTSEEPARPRMSFTSSDRHARFGSDGLTAPWSFPRGSFGTDRKARDQLSGGVRALNAGAARTTAALML